VPAPQRPATDGFERRSVTAQVLQRGMTGASVRALQQKLVNAGFMPLSDLRSGPGVYGPRTEAAVRRLQAAVGLPETGVAAPSTLAALNSGARYEPRPVHRAAPEVTQPTGRAAMLARLSETFSDDITQSMGNPIPS
jgi:peptidoglycan hydrolase-like protein with peptidoglycan-binding domain